MRLVVDTNVFVSGLLNGGGSPGRVIDAVFAGVITPVYSSKIIDEYREVLTRKKFAFNPDDVRILIEAIEVTGVRVSPEKSRVLLPDEKDRPFIDAAISSGCSVVTGNARHFPLKLGISILTPSECVRRLLTD